MEPWQRKHIQENISELIHDTNCDINFLSAFQSKGLLTQADVTTINSIRTSYDKSFAFYQLIQTRANSYERLKKILRKTSQTGALEKLNQINAKNAATPFKNFGTISYDKTMLLGRGSYNTKVFQGRFENRDVAVKFLSTEDVDINIAFKEINILTNLDWHENIVRYFKAEFTEDFVLIAIELCKMDLEKFINSSEPEPIHVEACNIVKQITDGLIFLHSKQIVHRDLKPANILISCPEEKKIYVKLSDFGLSRKLQDGRSRVTLSEVMGTPGWMAPEVIRQMDGEKDSEGKFFIRKAADIFSLGCIFYFVLTGGEHPFGKTFLRQGNILQGKAELNSKAIKFAEKFKAEAFTWLINQMLKNDERERPAADIILAHPAFWETSRILPFLEDIYPYVNGLREDSINSASRLATKSQNWNWLTKLYKPIKDFLKANGDVDGKKFSHLFKSIVEMNRMHYMLPKLVQQLLTISPQKYFTYWGEQFPFLLPMLWTIYQYSYGRPSILQKYYGEGTKNFKFGLLGRQQFSNKVIRTFSIVFPDLEYSSPLLRILEKRGEVAICKPKPKVPKYYISRVLKGANGFLSEEQLFGEFSSNVENKAIVISGPTAIGKTTLLVQMENKIHHEYPERRIIYLEARKVVAVLEGISKDQTLEIELFWSVLQRVVGESELDKTNIDSIAFNSNRRKTYMFFDGFNDVQEENQDFVCAFLGGIFTGFDQLGIRMWIATIPKYLDKIVKVLPLVDVYSIEPLDEKGQVELLTSYWEIHTAKERPALLEISNKCVAEYSNTICELGNPLQCLIVGAAHFVNGNFIYHSDFSISPEVILDLNNCYGNCLLDAAWKSSVHTLELILNLNKFNIDCVDNFGNTPLFLSACHQNNIDCLLKLKCLVARGANINHLNKGNANLLIFAARCASVEYLTHVLNLNQFDINSVNTQGCSPLFHSIYEKNNVDCLPKFKVLAERGASLTYLNKDNYNVLLFAARSASLQSLSYILDKNLFNINCKDNAQYTPLFLSVYENDNVDCIPKLKELIFYGANIHHVSENNNFNLLLFAARYASAESLDYIINMNKFEINSTDSWLNTPLFLSVKEKDNADCLSKLKLLELEEKGADLNHVNSDKMNLLHFSAQFASAEVFEYVLNMGKYNINSENILGNTPLLVTVYPYEATDCLKKLALLVDGGANLNHVNKRGSNLLHYGAQCASVNVLKYIIDLGKLDINSADKFGQTALLYAKNMESAYNVANNDLDLKVKLLIEMGCIEDFSV